MEQLKRMMSNLEHKVGCSELPAHRDIFDHIRAEIVDKHSYNDRTPPLDALCYAIKNILRPDFLLCQIPDLLDLLSNVELYRQEAVKAALRNEFYQKPEHSTSHILLTQEEQDLLRSLADKDCSEKRRSIYIQAIFHLCVLDIYQLWTSPDSYLLPVRLKEYFPSLIPSSGPSRRLFHYGLSDKEKKELHVFAGRCLKLIEDANEWETERKTNLEARGLSAEMYEEVSYKEAFTIAFSNTVDVATATSAIDFYLGRVQADVRALENLFTQDYG